MGSGVGSISGANSCDAGVAVAPKPSYIAFAAPAEFAAVTVHATELRLGLDLGDRPFDATLQRPKMKNPERAGGEAGDGRGLGSLDTSGG